MTTLNRLENAYAELQTIPTAIECVIEATGINETKILKQRPDLLMLHDVLYLVQNSLFRNLEEIESVINNWDMAADESTADFNG